MPDSDDFTRMCAVVFPIIEQYFTKSASYQYTDNCRKHDIINSLREQYLRTIKFRIHSCLADPVEKHISDYKSQQIEDAVPVDGD